MQAFGSKRRAYVVAALRVIPDIDPNTQDHIVRVVKFATELSEDTAHLLPRNVHVVRPFKGRTYAQSFKRFRHRYASQKRKPGKFTGRHLRTQKYGKQERSSARCGPSAAASTPALVLFVSSDN
ncbi:MAG: hypothetical protein DDT39_00800 [Firmicutes bacterium]|nr:hypothetical protein [candidate division NPL-UPA2 bacterium]